METVSAIQRSVETGFGAHAHTPVGRTGNMVLHDSRSLYGRELLVDCYAVFSSARLSLDGRGIFEFRVSHRFDHSPASSNKRVVLGRVPWPRACHRIAGIAIGSLCGSRSGSLPVTASGCDDRPWWPEQDFAQRVTRARLLDTLCQVRRVGSETCR